MATGTSGSVIVSSASLGHAAATLEPPVLPIVRRVIPDRASEYEPQ